MSVGAIGGNNNYAAQEAAKKPEAAKELTTVKVDCDKKHEHNRSCENSTSTKTTAKPGEVGYLLDEKV